MEISTSHNWWNMNQGMLKEMESKFGDVDWWDRVEIRKRLRALEQRIQNGIDVADIGCGTGIELQGYIRDKLHIVYSGFDVSSAMLDIAMKKFPKHKDCFHCLGAAEMGTYKGYFDAVVIRHVLEHQYNYIPVLEAARLICDDGGMVLLSCFRLSRAVEDFVVPLEGACDNALSMGRLRGVLDTLRLSVQEQIVRPWKNESMKNYVTALYVLRKEPIR